MGEAKNREPGGRKFHMYKREQFLFLMHVLNKPSKDREQRRKRKHMWEELGMDAAAKKVVELGPRPTDAAAADVKVGLDLYDWGDLTTPIPLRISGGTMDAMLAELAGELQGPAEVHLGEVEDRLIALRDGSYRPPDGLFPPDGLPPDVVTGEPPA